MHYYATNTIDWLTFGTIREAMKWCLEQPHPFCLVRVPLAADAEYTIDQYQPQVEGIEVLVRWEG